MTPFTNQDEDPSDWIGGEYLNAELGNMQKSAQATEVEDGAEAISVFGRQEIVGVETPLSWDISSLDSLYDPLLEEGHNPFPKHEKCASLELYPR